MEKGSMYQLLSFTSREDSQQSGHIKALLPIPLLL